MIQRLMPNQYLHEQEVALQAVRQAARICRTIQAEITPDVLSKKDKSPVTVADFSSQALICREVGDAFPDDPIVGEEDSAELRTPENAAFLQGVLRHLTSQGLRTSADEACRWIDRGGAQSFSSRFWTLDPIDGTKGFLRGEQYAVALALIVDGRIDLAVLGCPNLPFPGQAGSGTLCYAVRGQGAWMAPLEGASLPVKISVSPQSNAELARLCESVESGHSAHSESAVVATKLGISAEPVRMDSQAKYAAVARGDAEIYLRLPTRGDYREKIWDHAGGVLIVTEAGGRVTDIAGRPLEFHHGRELTANRGVVVTNGLLHDRVLAALA